MAEEEAKVLVLECGRRWHPETFPQRVNLLIKRNNEKNNLTHIESPEETE
jgi:hypothetical protein